jgi:hypothetical protein
MDGTIKIEAELVLGWAIRFNQKTRVEWLLPYLITIHLCSRGKNFSAMTCRPRRWREWGKYW